MKTVKVFAPATVANVAVGFDLLGFPLEGVGDTITVSTGPWQGSAEASVVIEEITWDEIVGDARSGDLFPKAAAKNTATVGLIELIDELKLEFGFRVKVHKGIPVGSGMGGSAASAVGAVVAANALLPVPLKKHQLLKFALLGEFVASGASHPDNAAPCLFGGLTLTRSVDPVEVVPIPVPGDILCVVVHPHHRLDTKESRAALKREVPLIDHVRQSAHLAGFIAGCCASNLPLIGSSLRDVLIEPQRARLIPGFARVQAAAMEWGALGCSISGSGPSVFAWIASKAAAVRAKKAMQQAFESAGLASEAWISDISQDGARVIS